MMAQLVYFKEWLTTLYKRHVEIILPILKLLFAFFALSMFQRMFYYNECIDKPWVFLAVSAVQAFLPISFLYYAISILIMINLWNVSMDIFLVFNVILGLETGFPVDLAAALQETMGMLKSPRRIDSVVSMTRRYRRNDNECFIEHSLLAGGVILYSVWSITPRIAKVNRDVIFLEHCTKI